MAYNNNCVWFDLRHLSLIRELFIRLFSLTGFLSFIRKNIPDLTQQENPLKNTLKLHPLIPILRCKLGGERVGINVEMKKPQPVMDGARS